MTEFPPSRLPPLEEDNTRRNLLWFVGIVVVLTLIVLLLGQTVWAFECPEGYICSTGKRVIHIEPEPTVTEADIVAWQYARAIEQYWQEKTFGTTGCRQIDFDVWLCNTTVYNSHGYKLFTVYDAVYNTNTRNYAKFINWNGWLDLLRTDI